MKEVLRLMKEVEYISAGQRIQDDDLCNCLYSIAFSIKKIASHLAAEEGDRE